MISFEWEKLGFNYIKTNSHIECEYNNGVWNEPKIQKDDSVSISIASTALQYSQSIMEGLKVFSCKDKSIKIFRFKDYHSRMQKSSKYICCPSCPENLFKTCLYMLVKDNIDYVPPYQSYGTFYIRVLLFGSGSIVGLKPNNKYKLLMFGMPVGNNYKQQPKPMNAYMPNDFDRVPAFGGGSYKLAGNYSSNFEAKNIATKKMCDVVLFLDPIYHKYIEEFATCNFIGIKDSTYVTPNSNSVLPSITNDTLSKIALTSLNMKIEKRKIEKHELNSFEEVAGCGTGVVLTPVSKILTDNNQIEYNITNNKFTKMLYNELIAIQYGETKDHYNWNININDLK